MTTPPSQAALKVIKTSEYRSGQKVWSNKYFLNQTSIPDSGHFNTLADAVTAAEKLIYDADTEILEVVGYNGGSSLPVFTKTYSLTGTFTKGSSLSTPLFVAGLIRYSTTQRTSKNHPLYLFNYYHGMCVSSSGSNEDLYSAQRTALQTYAADWVAGFSDGTTTYKKAGPRGAVAQGSFVQEYVTHRDFPA